MANESLKKDKHKTHYVIVIKEKHFPDIELFLQNVKGTGIITEEVKGSKVPLIFILIHVPENVVDRFSPMYGPDIEIQKLRFKQRKSIFNWTYLTPLSDISQYASVKRTSADRIIILYKILDNIQYGPALQDKGLSNLTKLNIIVDSYPLHDTVLRLNLSDINIPNDETKLDAIQYYNDRDLLYRYWANYKMWNKEIPLDLIKNYFGSEVAFYFAWLEYFNIMLTPIAILGIIVILISTILVYTQYIYRVNEICEGDNLFLCPDCLAEPLCVYTPISYFCDMSKATFVFDNYLTISLAILVSFWSTLFVNLWRRKTHILRLRWGVRTEDPALRIRKEYADSANKEKFNPITGTVEPYIPIYQKLHRIAFVILVCLCFILIDISVIFLLFHLRKWTRIYIVKSDVPFLIYNRKAIVLIVSCLVQITIINLFAGTYNKVSEWLTYIENPRTQKDFDNSVLYKSYLLAFANNYVVVLYTAFIKGNFYSTPRYSNTWLEKDSCQPLSCIVDLTVQLLFLMLLRRPEHYFKLIFESIKKIFFKKDSKELPQYEEEYLLEPTNKYFLTSNYNEMIVQYGFSIFFVAVLPLAPVYALISNVLRLREDAQKLIKYRRRPIPKMAAGIGAWDGILLGLTYLGTATNAFVLAFTTQFVEREVYKQTHENLKGFVNYTLSEFNTKDNTNYNIIKNKKDVCYYLAMRYPPGHSKQYELTGDYWTNFTWKLVFLILFEHLVFTSNSILSYCIGKVPTSVTEYLAYERQTNRETVVKTQLNQSEFIAMSQNRSDSYVELLE